MALIFTKLLDFRLFLKQVRRFQFLVLLLLSVNAFGQNYNMSNTTITTCSGNLYDSGGSGAAYGLNENFVTTICPSTAGQTIQLNFSAFNLESGFDFMYIYNGPNTNSPLIGSFTGNNSPGVISSTAAGGCLTILFTSDYLINNAGFAAAISCVNPASVVPSYNM